MKTEIVKPEIMSTDPAHSYAEIAEGVYRREDGALLVIAADGQNALLIDGRP